MNVLFIIKMVIVLIIMHQQLLHHYHFYVNHHHLLLQEEEVQPQVVGCSLPGVRADVPRLERPDRWERAARVWRLPNEKERIPASICRMYEGARVRVRDVIVDAI